MHGCTRSWREVFAAINNGSEMFRSCSAAATNDVHAEFGDKPFMMFGKSLGGEVVVHVAVNNAGKTSIRNARNGHAGMCCEMTEVLTHFHRTSRAVDADDVGMKGINCCEGSGDFGTGQHASGEFHCDLHLNGEFLALGPHSPAGTVHGGLHGEQVEHGLDDQQIDTTLDQRPTLRFVVVTEFCVTNLAKGRKASAWPNGTGNPTGSVRGGEVVSDPAGQASSSDIEFVDSIGDVIFPERDRKSAKGVRFDDIATHFEITRVHIGDHIWTRDHEQLVAAFEVGTAKVVGGHPAGLNACAHAAVENDDTIMYCFKESAHRGSPGDGPGAERGSELISPQAGASCPTHQVSFGSHTVAERGWNPTLEAGSTPCAL